MELFKLYRDVIKRGVKSWFGYLLQRCRYKNPAKPGKEIHIPVADIDLTINDRALSRVDKAYRKIYKSVNIIADGRFWDHLESISDSDLKLSGFREHFIEGLAWEETSLFAEYEKILQTDGKVQGCHCMEELVRRYEEEHDPLYESLQQEGIKSSRVDVRITPIYVYIYKDGRFVFTSGGNHRLNMAKILGLKTIPVRIKGRHVEWQRKRDELFTMGQEAFLNKYPPLAGHLDLEDCR